MKNSIIKSFLILFFFCLSLNIFAQLTTGLVSVWEFNEASVSVIDALGINNGTNSGATTNQTGKIGQSYLFNGTSNYVEVSHNSNLNPNGQDYSMNVWVKWEGEALSSKVGGVIQKGNYAYDGNKILVKIPIVNLQPTDKKLFLIPKTTFYAFSHIFWCNIAPETHYLRIRNYTVHPVFNTVHP